ESDQLSVSRLVGGSGQPAGSLVRLVEDASNTFALFQVDMDGSGPGGFVTLARLDGLHNGDRALVKLDEGLAAVEIVVGGGSPPPPPPPAVRLDAWILSNGRWAGSVDPGSHPAGFQVSGIGDFNRD